MENVTQKGLLPRLRHLAGCLYLSDLHNDFYARNVLDAMNVINISIYPLEQWQEAYQYITGRAAPPGSEKEIAWRLIQYLKDKINVD